jgi:serine/threonine protein kinase
LSSFRNLPAGTRIGGRYVVERELGHGRSSTVYLARDERAGSPVALKVLDPQLASDPVQLERLSREVETLRAIRHPSIIQVYDIVQEGALRAIAMEYLEGEDLSRRIERAGPFPLDRFAAVAGRIADALEACHSRGIVHRDIKPKNVVIDASNAIRIVDFGIAKMSRSTDLTRTGTSIGTPEYMAPELYASTRADRRSDIYSLGVVLYEMLTGSPPYVGTSIAEIMTAQARGEYRPVASVRNDVPPEVDRLITRCLRFDPVHRPASCAEVAASLRVLSTAIRELRAETSPALCLRCKIELFPGLAFCYGCREFSHQALEKGDHSLVLYRCDDPDRFSSYLARLFPSVRAARVKSRIARPPVPILRNISRDSAFSLQNELSGFACELAVVHNLPRELVLGRRQVLVGVLAALPVFVLPGLLAQLAWLAAVEGWIWGAFLRRIAPLVRAGSATGSGSEERALLAYAERIRKVEDAPTRAILASCLSVRARLSRVGPTGLVSVDEALERGARLAVELDEARRYLRERPSSLFRDQLRALDERVRSEREPGKLQALIEKRSKVEADRTSRLDMEEKAERFHEALLSLHASLRAMENEGTTARKPPRAA